MRLLTPEACRHVVCDKRIGGYLHVQRHCQAERPVSCLLQGTVLQSTSAQRTCMCVICTAASTRWRLNVHRMHDEWSINTDASQQHAQLQVRGL
jgi:hypothetical protein